MDKQEANNKVDATREEFSFESILTDYRTHHSRRRWASNFGFDVKDIKVVDGGRFFCSDASSMKIIFTNCVFDGKIEFFGRSRSNIGFRNCQFNEAVVVNLEKCTEDISFWECKFASNLVLNRGEYKSISIKSSMNQLLINAGKFQNVYLFERSQFQSVHISFSSIIGSIEAKGVEIGTLSINGLLKKESEFLLTDCQIKNIDIDSFTNEGRMKICDTNVGNDKLNDNYIVIRYSNLGKAEWYNFDFNYFETFNIYSSYISESNFIKVNWPTAILKFGKFYDLDEARNIIGVYRQIKYCYSKQGDSIAEHEFHALEMRARLHVVSRQLFDTVRFRKSTGSFFWQNLQDWFVLFLSRVSSNFGLSWTRPILFLVILSVPLFILIVALRGMKNLVVDISPYSFLNSWNYIPEWLYFMSPLRKMDLSTANWSIIPDLILRITSSYSIYNIVRATRRFVK